MTWPIPRGRPHAPPHARHHAWPQQLSVPIPVLAVLWGAPEWEASAIPGSSPHAPWVPAFLVAQPPGMLSQGPRPAPLQGSASSLEAT